MTDIRPIFLKTFVVKHITAPYHCKVHLLSCHHRITVINKVLTKSKISLLLFSLPQFLFRCRNLKNISISICANIWLFQKPKEPFWLMSDKILARHLGTTCLLLSFSRIGDSLSHMYGKKKTICKILGSILESQNWQKI